MVTKIHFRWFGFSFVIINLEPSWLPANTAITQKIQIDHCGCACKVKCEQKLDMPEHVTMKADVAAAIFISKPIT
jgi:hypothetical protein